MKDFMYATTLNYHRHHVEADEKPPEAETRMHISNHGAGSKVAIF